MDNCRVSENEALMLYIIADSHIVPAIFSRLLFFHSAFLSTGLKLKSPLVPQKFRVYPLDVFAIIADGRGKTSILVVVSSLIGSKRVGGGKYMIETIDRSERSTIRE